MFFNDDKFKKNVNQGNKSISNRDEFLKKLKSEKVNEKDAKKKAIAYSVIEGRIKSFKLKLTKTTIIEDRLSNLKAVSKLLIERKELEISKKNQVIDISITKLNSQLVLLFQSYNFNSSKVAKELTACLVSLISSLTSDFRESFLKKNRALIILILKTMFIRIYQDACCKGILIDQFNANNKELIGLWSSLPLSELFPVTKELFASLGFNYIITKILEAAAKIIDTGSLAFYLNFAIDLVKQLSAGSSQILHSIKRNLIKIIIDTSAQHIRKLQLDIDSIIQISHTINYYSYLKYLTADELISFVSQYRPGNDQSHSILYLQSSLIFIKDLFFYLSLKQLSCLVVQDVVKQDLLKNICRILEQLLYIGSSSELILSPYFQRAIILDKVLIISHTLKLIKAIYFYSNESLSSYSILDYIFNKSISQQNKTVIDDILQYSVYRFLIHSGANKGLVKELTSEDIEVLEIVSFSLDQKIQYQSKDFIHLSKKTDMENLPFNIIYLRSISKALLKVFVQMQGMQESLDNSGGSIITHCIKSLFYLDDEIEFTPNKESFWQDSELLVKIAGMNELKQLEHIKIMPFIFPIRYRINIFFATSTIKSNKDLIILAMNHQVQLIEMQISRQNIFDNAFNLYFGGLLDHRAPWKITFINNLGMVEDGQDAGGLFLEFINKLCEVSFSKEVGFFVESATGFLYPNTNSVNISEYHLKVFEFLGYIIGIAIINEVQVWPNFSTFFLNNLLSIENSFIELKNYDQDLYTNLVALQEYRGNVEEDFGLNFMVTEQLPNKKIIEKELIPNGKNIAVTGSNKLMYIRKVAKYKLENQFKDQCEAFKNGMQKVLNESAYSLFTSNELRQIIAGFDKDICVTEWQFGTIYSYFDMNNKKHEQAIMDFWSIVWEMDQKEKEKLLFFVTSLKRPPLTGFKNLNPRFNISYTDHSFPSASTCINQLKLPILKKDELKKAILYAINADSGFYFA